MFNLCCSASHVVTYSIDHYPKPLILSSDMEAIIKRILWYVPNIDSYQSPQIEVINDKKVYNEILFQYILNTMGIDKDCDVHLLSSKECIDDAEWDYFCHDICTSCQKIIISVYDYQSKTKNLLRCVRNCIAHGHFAIVDDYLIGFNINHNKTKHIDEKKAIIKIKPKLLLSALDSLPFFEESEKAKFALISYVLQKHGYSTESNIAIFSGNNERKIVDLLAEKNENRYAIEIKSSINTQYTHYSDLISWFESMQHWDYDAIKVLFIDTSRIVKDVRKAISDISNCLIIDTSDITEMMSDDSTDKIELQLQSKINASI